MYLFAQALRDRPDVGHPQFLLPTEARKHTPTSPIHHSRRGRTPRGLLTASHIPPSSAIQHSSDGARENFWGQIWYYLCTEILPRSALRLTVRLASPRGFRGHLLFANSPHISLPEGFVTVLITTDWHLPLDRPAVIAAVTGRYLRRPMPGTGKGVRQQHLQCIAPTGLRDGQRSHRQAERQNDDHVHLSAISPRVLFRCKATPAPKEALSGQLRDELPHTRKVSDIAAEVKTQAVGRPGPEALQAVLKNEWAVVAPGLRGSRS
ncbi:hypothetical protein FKP32DRAFT_1601014 [Trametes sanguinea]|nr:hypothetical protein FKP32DRAFT_1601014 [Trametes sanguinea]